MVALIILVLSLTLQAIVQPYASKMLNILDVGSLFILVVTQIISILYLYLDTADTKPFGDSVSSEALELVMTCLLFLANISVIVTLFAAFIIRIGYEKLAQKIFIEKQARRAMEKDAADDEETGRLGGVFGAAQQEEEDRGIELIPVGSSKGGGGDLAVNPMSKAKRTPNPDIAAARDRGDHNLALTLQLEDDLLNKKDELHEKKGVIAAQDQRIAELTLEIQAHDEGTYGADVAAQLRTKTELITALRGELAKRSQPGRVRDVQLGAPDELFITDAMGGAAGGNGGGDDDDGMSGGGKARSTRRRPKSRRVVGERTNPMARKPQAKQKATFAARRGERMAARQAKTARHAAK